MTNLRRFALCLTIFSLFNVLSIQAKGEKAEKAIYGFTFGTCFSDSTVYFSTTQPLIGARQAKDTKFLVNRSAYAAAFKTFLDTKYEGQHTCAVFFNSKRNSLEKKYLKLRKAYQKKGFKVTEVPVTDFNIPGMKE